MTNSVKEFWWQTVDFNCCTITLVCNLFLCATLTWSRVFSIMNCYWRNERNKSSANLIKLKLEQRWNINTLVRTSTHLCLRQRYPRSSKVRQKCPWFQVSAAMLIRSALFGILRRVVVALYRRFGTKHRYHLQGSRSLLGLLGDFLAIEDGTDTLSRNVGKGLPLDSA